MTKYLITFAFCGLLVLVGKSQSGCPGCTINLPADLALDTAYLGIAPDAQVGVYYEADIPFRLPKTTTPVADENTPPGLPIDQITVRNVTNIPPGLNWEANQLDFMVADTTDGCVRICGTPLQPGFYEVEVVLTAKVLLSSSTTSFSFPIVVRQSVTETEGFTMINNSGCGDLVVSFENKITSNGQAGFSYLWEFGNGNFSLDEDPVDQYYNQPGIYPVQYEAVVDTAGYTLNRIVVNEVGCDDTFNRPDLQVSVFNMDNDLVYRSQEFTNAIPPLTIDNIGLELDDGNYFLEVVDIDDGIGGGGDDPCGIVNFNRYTSGKLTDLEMSVTLNISHPVETIRSVDTVFVFPQPEAPLITADIPEVLCLGDSLQLVTDYAENIQWYRDSLSVLEGDTSVLTIRETGDYWLQYTSPDGCIAVSEVLGLSFPDPPASPVFVNTSNELTLFDPAVLPRFYALQWFFEDQPIEGAIQEVYCIGESGDYSLVVTDLETGCSSFYERSLNYDPKFPGCVSSTIDPFAGLLEAFKLYPNPTVGTFWLEWYLADMHDAALRLRNVQGQVLRSDRWEGQWGQVRQPIDIGDLPAGIYFLELSVQDRMGYFRVVKH